MEIPKMKVYAIRLATVVEVRALRADIENGNIQILKELFLKYEQIK